MPRQLDLHPGHRLCLAAGTLARLLSGSVNARVVPYRETQPQGAGIHLATLVAAEGQPTIALALDAMADKDASEVRIELSAASPAVVLLHALSELRPGEVAATLDPWIRTVERVGAWTPFAAPRALFPGHVTVQMDEIVAAPRDCLVWLSTPAGWRAVADGAPCAWDGPSEVEVMDTVALAEAGILHDALRAWISSATVRLRGLLAHASMAQQASMVVAAEAARHAAISARAVIAGVRVPQASDIGQSPMRAALAVAVPDYAIQPIPASTDETALTLAVQAGLGAREVALDEPLGREDGPPLLVTLENADGAGRPAAMLAERGRYAIAEPDGEVTVRPTRLLARGWRLGRRAVALTPPLGDRLVAALGSPLRLPAALVRSSARDAAAAVVWGLAGVAMAAALPVAINLLFASIWPRADVTGHWLVVAGLAIAGLGGVGFEAARSARAGRLTLRFLNRLENGLWLALVRARPQSLEGRSAGDVQSRIGALTRLRQSFAGQPMRLAVDLGALLTGFALMAFYGGVLAWIGVAAVLLLGLCWGVLIRQSIRTRTEAEEIGGQQTALLTQAIAAIVKVKATASEGFILARWATLADRHRAAVRRAERIDTLIAVATAGISGISTAAVFAVGGLVLSATDAGSASGMPTISLGAFLAFQTSLGQTVAAAGSVASVFALWPLLSAAGTRLLPLASAAPEMDPAARRIATPPLDGRITISHVTHRYPGADAPSLDDVNIDIAAREYVAIVGASGSGKSTLLRIVLGLEQPVGGAVYFDGLDARRLDPAQLRRQVGYVGQDARLAPGSILENILDGRQAGAPEAWEAVRLAGLADEIDAMPMGMHTLVGEAGQNLSGGQRQRLLIARALLTRPRILIFDEATSALDNTVQAVVQRGVAELPVTRIVVAHRLSTLTSVDQVFVLAKGRLVESGRPSELLQRGGAFAALAGRQRVDAAAEGRL